MNNKIFHSKFLVIFTLFLFIVLISSDVFPQRTVAAVQDIEQLIREGKQLYEDGEYEAAKNTLLNALTRARAKKDRSEVYFNLSLAFYAVAQNNKTKEMLERLFKIQPERTIDERYYPSGYVEIFNQVRGKEIPVVKGKFGPPGKVKKGGGGIFIIVGLLAAGGGAAALLLSKKSAGDGAGGGDSGSTTGSIQVNSTPTGASVYLDGSNTGYTTNCTLTSVSAGSHTIKLVKEGYQDYETSVSVTAGQTSSVDATLTAHTITVIDPTSSTVWTMGEQVEITWETDESSRSAGNMRAGSGLNSLSSGSSVASSYQRRRAIRYRRSFLEVRRVRRGLESMGLWQDKEISVSKLSRIKGISKKSSSSGKEVESVPQRGIDIGIKRNDMRFERINFPRIPKNSYQRQTSFSKMKILAIANVKIELYKGGSLVETIVSSTDNDSSYTWTVDTSLEDGTDYKVRISCATDSEVYGESDEFTIEEKSITITEPTSSTVWYRGSSATIEWTWNGDIDYVKIELYKGTTLKGTISTWVYNDGSYTWDEVDTTLEEGTDYKVRIIDEDDSSLYGESAQFEIKKAEITVTNPTSSTVWYKGASATIEWTTTDSINYVKIELYKGTTLKKTISTWTYNDGSHTWSTVDTSLDDGTDYKVKISDQYDSDVYGESAQFEIAPPSITVTNPTSSTVWYKASSATIEWSWNGDIDYVKIQLYKGTTLKETIDSYESNDGSYTLSTVDTSLEDGTDYKVRISDQYDSDVYGESAQFEIKSYITVTEPTSSTVWNHGQSVDITWTWAGTTSYINTTSYVKIDLYKGSSWTKTIVSSTENDGSYTWSEVDTALTDGTDYKVRITSTTDSNLYGESDYFTIGEPSITVTEPTSSTVWYKGESGSITWTTRGECSYVKIDLYKGTTWKELITSSTYNDGSYTWSTVNTSLEDGTDYGVKVSCTADSSIYGESAQFEIATPSITVTKPTSSTVWYKGGSGSIEWTWEGDFSYVKIELYKGTTLKKTITTYASNDGSYTWSTVDTSLEDGTDYKLRISDQYNSDVYGESAQFQIAPPSITVTEPTSSTVWYKGESASIEWTWNGSISYVKIELYKGTTLEKTIDSWESNDGSYTWSTVDTSLDDGIDYKVKISNYYDSTIYDESAQFQITSPSITVTSPASGTVWKKGESADITWTYEGTFGYAKIQLYKGGSLKKTIVSSTSNDGSYTWSEVDTSLDDGLDYKVKVSNYYNSSVYDESDNFTITSSYSFLIEWGSYGNGDGYFYYPRGVAVDSSGYIYVSDTYNHRIQKFTSSGSFSTKWGSYGTGTSQFRYPRGVAVDSSGNVYVADTSNHRIQKFTSDGTYVTEWGSQGSGSNQFYYPYGVAVDSSGNVYVADTYNHRIMKFSSNGTYITQWGSYGVTNSQFKYPGALAIDSFDYVYVADSDNHRIQKFTSSGTYTTSWGSNGSDSSEFQYTYGIAIDSSGYVYVSDYNNHRIQKFTSSGTYVTQWGTYGNSAGQFNNPYGVAVDSSGYVYVVDQDNHRLQKFGLSSTSQRPAASTFFPLNTNLKNRENSESRSDLIKSPLINKSKRTKAQQKIHNKKTRKNEKRN